MRYSRLSMPLSGHPLRTLILTSLACLLGAVSGAGNCSQIIDPSLLVSNNGSMVLQQTGRLSRIFSAVDGEIHPESLYLNFSVLGIAERNKTYPFRSCRTPNGLGTTPFDTEYDGGMPYAPMYRYFDGNDWDCYTYKDTKVIQGITIRGLYSKMSQPDYPSLSVVFAYEFADTELEIFPTNDTTYTTGRLFSYHWDPNRLKVSIDVTGVPWNASLWKPFISLHFQFASTLPAGGVGRSSDDRYGSRFLFNTSKQFLGFDFEKCFMIDGIPSCSNQDVSGDDFTLGPVLEDFPFSFHTGVPFCENHFSRWNYLIYDPTLASLFTVLPTDENVDNPQVSAPAKRTNKAVLGAVIGSVVGVAVVAIVIAILATHVPAFKKCLRPFSNRAHNATTSTRGDKRDSEWTKAQKPGQP